MIRSITSRESKQGKNVNEGQCRSCIGGRQLGRSSLYVLTGTWGNAGHMVTSLVLRLVFGES